LIKKILNSNIEFGHTAVDAQHRYIIDLSKKIEQVPANEDKIAPLCSLFRKYRRLVKKHFLLEEEILEFLVDRKYIAHRFSHVQSHKNYINYLNNIMKEIADNKDVSVSKEIINYAFNGFHLHMAQYDSEMFGFLKVERVFREL